MLYAFGSPSMVRKKSTGIEMWFEDVASAPFLVELQISQKMCLFDILMIFSITLNHSFHIHIYGKKIAYIQHVVVRYYTACSCEILDMVVFHEVLLVSCVYHQEKSVMHCAVWMVIGFLNCLEIVNRRFSEDP